jgi:uncharacterized membrane protein YhaH (DUF805 family)
MTRETIFKRPMFKHRMFQHPFFHHPMFDISFKDPATRTEYWTVYLRYFLLGLASIVVYFILGALLGAITHSDGFVAVVFVCLFVAEALLFIVFGFAVTARRCIDIGINPLFTLLVCIPYIGFAAAIVLGLLETGSVKNRKADNETAGKTTASTLTSSGFVGEKDFTNDAYKIYLTKAYQIEKNDTLGKFVCTERLFSTVDEALVYADHLEKNKALKQQEIEKAKADLERAQSGQAVKDCPHCKRWNAKDAKSCQWCQQPLDA